MPSTRRPTFGLLLALSLLSSLNIAACGGGSGNMSAQQPITVSLVITKITLSQNGTPVSVGIIITSTSETALVSVNGLPSGVRESYASSDTNPSGSLTFSASTATPPGIYMPVVNVMSAGQFTSTAFTLIVNSTTTTGP